MVPDLVRYLEELSVHLRLNPLKERQVIREMYTHLEDRVTELEGDGLTQREAVRVATKGFGPPKVVAEELFGAHGVGTWTDALLAASPYFGVFLLFYGLLRFLVEFFRVQTVPGFDVGFMELTRGQALTVPIILMGAWILWVRRKAA